MIFDESKMRTTDVPETAIAKWLGGRSFAEAFEQYDREGYIIFENVMTADEVDAYQAALEPYMVHNGRNDFEGLHTNRVYALLAKSPLFADMVAHPLALAFAEAELGRSWRRDS